MKSKLFPGIPIAALLGALALGGTVLAMTGERCGPGGGHLEPRMKEIPRLRDELKLDARQAALRQQAEQLSSSSRQAMREQMRQQGERALATVNQPAADLRRVIQQMDQLRAAGRAQHEAVRDRWLAVYDALDAAQKEQARLFFTSRLERLAHWGGFGKGEISGD
ncbi:MAG: periplasmic heavy metal sensor [Candidatus Accumulibacter sp.]|nr:periplasmic heavy metal sensor [Accumulibacter sp.]